MTEFKRVQARLITFVAGAILVLTGCTATGAISEASPPSPSPTAESEAAQASASQESAALPELDYLEVVLGEADPEAELPLLITIHGYGDSPEGISGLFSAFDEPVRMVLPRGRFAHPRRGFSWYAIGQDRTVEQATESAAAIAALATRLSSERPTRGRAIVAGFSQGGVLSFALAAEHDGVFGTAMPIAGFLPDAESYIARHTRHDRSTVVRAFHGADDTMILAADGQSTVAALHDAGWDAEIQVFPALGHSTNAALREALFVELRQAIARSLTDAP